MSLVSRKLIQAAAGAGVDTGDDDFANVVLLLDGDGTSDDNNNTFTDSSTNGFTVTENGSVVQGSFSPYGDNWSNSFDGNSDALIIADSADFDFGTGDFTMEAWVYPRAFTGNYNQNNIISAHEGTDNTAYSFAVYSDGKLQLYGGGGNNDYSTSTVSLNEWTHVMVTRSSGTVRFFINGTLDASTYTRTGNYNCTAQGLAIGKQPIDNGGAGATRYWNGWLSNVRMVKGTALQTSSFTPSTSPLTAVTNTSLLACQSNRFVDNSSSSHTLTPNGTPKVTPFSPFKDDDARDITTDGGSGFFNSTGNYLSLTHSADLKPGASGAFSIELWYYAETNSTTRQLVGDFKVISYPSNCNGFDILENNDNTVRLRWGNPTYQTIGAGASETLKAGQWHHIAVCRDAEATPTISLFVNGVRTGTTTSNTGITDSTLSNFYLGWAGSQSGTTIPPALGNICDVRMLKGSTAYDPTQTTLTVPTSPLTAITNTELLANFQDAGIYDRSGINNLDTVGNAQIDTAVKKYGTGSMEFDGTGDYLTTNSLTELSFGTGDFTIEGWFYIQSGDEYPFAIDFRSAESQAAVSLYFYNYGNGSIDWYVSGASRILGTSAGNDVWQHIAVCRSGTSTKMFVNGTQTGSTYTDSTNYVAYSGNIARRYTNQRHFKGFIDDLRITKGVARYTANFTPPTEALPKF